MNKIPTTIDELKKLTGQGLSIADAGLLAETMVQTAQVFNDYDTHCKDLTEWDQAVMLHKTHIENLGMGPAALMLAMFNFEELRILFRDRKERLCQG